MLFTILFANSTTTTCSQYICDKKDTCLKMTNLCIDSTTSSIKNGCHYCDQELYNICCKETSQESIETINLEFSSLMKFICSWETFFEIVPSFNFFRQNPSTPPSAQNMQ
jgi:hypothetical protein